MWKYWDALYCLKIRITQVVCLKTSGTIPRCARFQKYIKLWGYKILVIFSVLINCKFQFVISLQMLVKHLNREICSRLIALNYCNSRLGLPVKCRQLVLLLLLLLLMLRRRRLSFHFVGDIPRKSVFCTMLACSRSAACRGLTETGWQNGTGIYDRNKLNVNKIAICWQSWRSTLNSSCRVCYLQRCDL